MNFSLIDNSKRVKMQHLNNSRLHLNKKGSQVLSDVNCKEIIKIFKWYIFRNSSFDENDSNDSFQIDKRDECNNILNNIQMDNRNKLVFGHFNINSIHNKFELLSKQVKGNIDVLMISETKVETILLKTS